MIELRDAVHLLGDLESNNTRDWYQAHKTEIQEKLLNSGLAACDELRLILESECQTQMTSKVYRMNRDLRFSKDKTPYNPHFRFSIWQAEFLQQSSVCFHFSIEPSRITMGVGLCEFGEKLEVFRNKCGELASLLTPEIRLSEPELKRIPVGTPAAPEFHEHYRRKGLTGWIDIYHPESGIVGFNPQTLRSIVPIYNWLGTL